MDTLAGRFSGAFLFCVLISFGGRLARATIYNDGGTHTISGADTDVVISNGTTVNIVPGATVMPAFVYDPFGGNAIVSSGSLNVTGGSVTGGDAKFGGSGLVANGGYYDISGGTFQGGSSGGLTSGGEMGGAGAISRTGIHSRFPVEPSSAEPDSPGLAPLVDTASVSIRVRPIPPVFPAAPS